MLTELPKPAMVVMKQEDLAKYGKDCYDEGYWKMYKTLTSLTAGEMDMLVELANGLDEKDDDQSDDRTWLHVAQRLAAMRDAIKEFDNEFPF